MRPSARQHAPPGTRISASAKNNAGLAQLRFCANGERNDMEGAVADIATPWCAASIHVRAHKDGRPGRNGAGSTDVPGSPEKDRRYCQKFSPGPARRRPCNPWITVAAMRRASRMRRGMDSRQCACRAARVLRRPDFLLVRRVACWPSPYPMRDELPTTASMVSPSGAAAKVSAMRCLRIGSAISRTSSMEARAGHRGGRARGRPA